MSKCSIEGCNGLGDKQSSGKRIFKKGLCTKHYSKLLIYGDPLVKFKVYGENRTVHPLYIVYKNMKSRCLNTNNPDYEHYGGRGITICKEWLGLKGFPTFVTDMGIPTKGLTLDRIDNDLGYYKDNCRWATREVQNLNQRKRSNNPGVNFNKVHQRWIAVLKRNKIIEHFSYHLTKESAIKARFDAEEFYTKNLQHDTRNHT
jgi:hypothetical protein